MRSTTEWFDIATDQTKEATIVVRQLALACVGAVWVFRTTNGEVAADLRLPLVLVLIGLLFDVFQYVWLGLAHWLFARHHEVRNVTHPEKPPWITNVGWALWLGKIGAILFAAVLLFSYLL